MAPAAPISTGTGTIRNSDYAEELDSLAREVVRHAVAIERRFRVAAA